MTAASMFLAAQNAEALSRSDDKAERPNLKAGREARDIEYGMGSSLSCARARRLGDAAEWTRVY